MIRLLMACAVAYSLMPENVAINNASLKEAAQSSQLTTQDTLSAVQSMVSDVLRFCDRNVETCLTVQALATEAKQTVIQTLNSLSSKEANLTRDDNVHKIDEETTSSTKQ